MASYAFEQFKKSQKDNSVTHSYTIAPLFCKGCLGRIEKGLVRNNIIATCKVTRYGQRDGDQSGDIHINVQGSVSYKALLEILTIKMGFKLPDASSRSPSIGW